jgi:hypothetical protein
LLSVDQNTKVLEAAAALAEGLADILLQLWHRPRLAFAGVLLETRAAVEVIGKLHCCPQVRGIGCKECTIVEVGLSPDPRASGCGQLVPELENSTASQRCERVSLRKAPFHGPCRPKQVADLPVTLLLSPCCATPCNPCCGNTARDEGTAEDLEIQSVEGLRKVHLKAGNGLSKRQAFQQLVHAACN